MGIRVLGLGVSVWCKAWGLVFGESSGYSGQGPKIFWDLGCGLGL